MENRTVGFWFVASMALLGATGCGVDPGEVSTSGTAGSGSTSTGSVCPDDPKDGPVLEECGIWVSAEKGSDADDGTHSAPVATLKHAIELAQKGPGRVYACGGETWSEPIVVPGNVSLHGGFDCSAGWAYVGEAKRTNLVTGPDRISLTWIDSSGGKGADMPFLTDFLVQAADAVTPGGSSIAMLVRDDMELHFHRCQIIAGNGADGLDGAPGDADDLPAAAGTAGIDGANACSAPVSKGGAAPESACPSSTSKGGAGGDGGPMIAANGTTGEPGGPPPAGEGGLGEQAAPVCTNGVKGANGIAAANGGGGKGQGFITPDGYVGIPGHDAADGPPGQGGGGGGATFGKAAVCGAAKPGGAAGGSGGAGGCGGKGGRGGQAGGSSIAIVTHGWVFPQDGLAESGRGGNGGNGGAPQLGGAGGIPGKGGAGSGSIKAGCAGGAGGDGGQGGWGGGGQGGHSIAFGYSPGRGQGANGLLKQVDEAGKGGMGQPWDVKSHGDDGIGQPNWLFDPEFGDEGD